MHNPTCDVMFLYRKLLLILSGLCEGKHSYKATLASKSLERSQLLWVPGLWLSHPQNTKKFLRSKYHYKPLERHLDSQCFYLSESVTREPRRKGLCCVFFSILFLFSPWTLLICRPLQLLIVLVKWSCMICCGLFCRKAKITSNHVF